MKKIPYVLLFTIIVITSCEKTYNCECTVIGKAHNDTITHTTYAVTAKKKDKEAACNALSQGDQGLTVETCEIK
jgi:hypothetical protein